MTNGDKIRNFSNEQLAEFLETAQTVVYKVFYDNGIIPKIMYNSALNSCSSARISWLNWLNKEEDLGGFIKND